MKFKLVLFLLSIILTYSQAFHNGPVINLRRNTQNLNNHNNRNIIQNIPARFSQAHSTSQITASEKIATSSYAEAGAGAGENPIFTLNIHAPQETTDEIIGIKIHQNCIRKNDRIIPNNIHYNYT